MAAQVMIEFVPDMSKVKSGLETLQESGAAGESAEAFKAGNAELEKRNKLLAQTAAAEDKVAQGQQKELATIKQVTAATDKLASSVIKISGSEFQKMMKETGLSAEQTVNALAGVTEETNELTAAQNANTQSTVSLRTEKKKLQQEIATLIDRGEQESQMFRELVARAGEIDDAMSDASDAIRRTGSDTRALDNALIAARGVAAGFTVLTGAAALFGGESEEVQKVLLKVNAAMAVLNGLQEIQNILKSEYVKTLIASITATRTETTAIVAETAATEGATVAQTGLNAAMAANPILLVIAALGAVVTAIALFTDESEKAEQSQIHLNKALNDITNTLADYNIKLDKSLEIEKALAQLRGETGSQIAKLELDALNQKIAKTKEAADQAQALSQDEKKTAQERFAASKEYYRLILNVIPSLEQAARLKNIEGEKEFNAERKKFTEEQKKAFEEAQKEAEKLRLKYKELDTTIQAFFRSLQPQSEGATAALAGFAKEVDQMVAERPEFGVFEANAEAKAKATADSLLAVLTTHLAARTKKVDEQAKKEKEIRDAVGAAAIQSALAVSDAIFSINQERRSADLEAQLSTLEKEKEAALQTKNLTEAQKNEIQQRYDKQLAQLKTEAAKKERKAQTNQALVNTFLAITNALASAPWPYNIIAAAAAGVAGFAQVMRIQNTPIPQYKKGVRNAPKGMAWVGEEGPELVEMKGGENVYTTRHSDRIAREWNASQDDRRDRYRQKEKVGEYIDYEEIGRQVAAHMPEITTVNMVADENGLSVFLTRQQSRIAIRNRRYST